MESEIKSEVRSSLYWDAFESRAKNTVFNILNNKVQKVERVAVFVTNKCNLACRYCNSRDNNNEMKQEKFIEIVEKHNDAIIHITGGEPSVVRWLYPTMEELNKKYPKISFHLNTNAVLTPPTFVKRLKVSLDSANADFWNDLVGRRGAFEKVVNNIKNAIPTTVVSITFTMSKANYKEIPRFIKYTRKEFSGLYALFFSVYKGTNPEFAITDEVANDFFTNIKPIMDAELDEESRNLLNETMDEKMRVMQGVRFPENNNGVCYLSLSERVYRHDGTESACSHLFRDGILNRPGEKHEKCNYGCNRRLVAFNELVERKLRCQSI